MLKIGKFLTFLKSLGNAGLRSSFPIVVVDGGEQHARHIKPGLTVIEANGLPCVALEMEDNPIQVPDFRPSLTDDDTVNPAWAQKRVVLLHHMIISLHQSSPPDEAKSTLDAMQTCLDDLDRHFAAVAVELEKGG